MPTHLTLVSILAAEHIGGESKLTLQRLVNMRFFTRATPTPRGLYLWLGMEYNLTYLT